MSTSVYRSDSNYTCKHIVIVLYKFGICIELQKQILFANKFEHSYVYTHIKENVCVYVTIACMLPVKLGVLNCLR